MMELGQTIIILFGEAIIELYTRESFLYRVLNKSERDRDKDKIKTLGPFSYLLNKCCDRYSGEKILLYRGALLTRTQLDEYNIMMKEESIFHLPSITSTSKKKLLD
eukprot:UN16862